MVAREDHCTWVITGWRVLCLPLRHPFGEALQSRQCTRRLSQLKLALNRFGCGLHIRAWQFRDHRANFVETIWGRCAACSLLHSRMPFNR